MDAVNMKSCSLFLDNINDYLDGELDAETAKAVREHLDGCPDCRKLYGESVLILKELSSLDEQTAIPLECQAAWRKSVRGEAKRVSGRKTARNFLRAAGAIAAAAVVVFGVNSLMPKQVNVISARSIASYDADYGTTSDSVYTAYNSAKSATGNMLLQADGEFAVEESLASDASDDAAAVKSVIIRNAKRKIESQNFDQCVKSIADLVEEYQGYFEQNTVEGRPIESGSSSGRTASMTARVPSVDLDAFLTGVDAVGNVTYSRVTAEDISESYYDTQSRLESYKKQLSRLNELVTTAADLEQLLLLEDKISETQYSIDSLEGTIKSWDSQVSYSSVSISVTETAQRDKIAAPAQSMGERARTAFYDGLNWLNELWQNTLVALAAAAPALIIIIPLAAIILVIITLVKKKRKI